MPNASAGPFSADTVKKAADAFYAAAERRDVKFGIWEYTGTYDNPAGGISIGWYYSDGLKEWGNRMDFDYSRRLNGNGPGGGFPDDAAAIYFAKHLGLNAGAVDLTPDREEGRLMKDVAIAILAMAMLPLHAVLLIFGKVDAADHLIEWWKKYVV